MYVQMLSVILSIFGKMCNDLSVCFMQNWLLFVSNIQILVVSQPCKLDLYCDIAVCCSVVWLCFKQIAVSIKCAVRRFGVDVCATYIRSCLKFEQQGLDG